MIYCGFIRFKKIYPSFNRNITVPEEYFFFGRNRKLVKFNCWLMKFLIGMMGGFKMK